MAFGGECYFLGTGQGPWAGTGQELYCSDGTPAGTRLVADFYPGINGGAVRLLGVFQNELYFAGTSGASGIELCKTDGTAAGTVLVADLNQFGNGDPVDFTVAGGLAFFRATSFGNGTELWVTDGTTAGTRMLNVNAGSADGVIGVQNRRDFHLIALGGEVYFQRRAGSFELYKSDGTAAGTVPVQNAAGQPFNGQPLGVL
ncbi:MAG: hypothetical protein KDC98_07995, partial [Planctomycetes bacterium]|nr:hypothetical protein [Planctomycetota bacterium]